MRASSPHLRAKSEFVVLWMSRQSFAVLCMCEQTFGDLFLCSAVPQRRPKAIRSCMNRPKAIRSCSGHQGGSVRTLFVLYREHERTIMYRMCVCCSAISQCEQTFGDSFLCNAVPQSRPTAIRSCMNRPPAIRSCAGHQGGSVRTHSCFFASEHERTRMYRMCVS